MKRFIQIIKLVLLFTWFRECTSGTEEHAHLWNSEKSPELFFNKSLVSLERLLPTVLILPVKPTFYRELYTGQFNLTTGAGFLVLQHDAIFTMWMNQSYSHAIKSDSQSVEADYFYIPAYRVNATNGDLTWWNQLDVELESMKSKYENYILDRTFLGSAHPNTVSSGWKKEAFFNHNRRNVGDIRLLRVDNDMTINGRDVFVPFIIPRHSFRHDIYNYSRREYILTAFCKEAGGRNDMERQWRTHLYRKWHNIPHAIVSEHVVEGAAFVSHLLHSDFCVIIPGDTSSTSKLYKAIFAGCIPVIFLSFPEQLPFHSLIDWSLFSVIVYKDIIYSTTKMGRLLIHLQAIRGDKTKLRTMKYYVNEVANLFDYTRLEFPSVYHFTLLQMVNSDSGSKNLMHRYD